MKYEEPMPWMEEEARNRDREGFEDAYARYLTQLDERNHPWHGPEIDVDKPAPKMSWWDRVQLWLLMRGFC